jgi:chromosome segregation ATPase
MPKENPFLPPLPEQELHLLEREKEHFEVLRRQSDKDLQERKHHLTKIELKQQAVNRELEQRHAQLLEKEKQLVLHQTQANQIKSLQEEIEDTKVSVLYQKEELERRSLDLDTRQAILDAKEKQLEALYKALPIFSQKPLTQVIDDHPLLEKRFHAHIAQKHMPAHQSITLQVLRKHIAKAYMDLESAKLADAKAEYSSIKAQYAQYVKEHGPHHILYQEIVSLHATISTAIKHLSATGH